MEAEAATAAATEAAAADTNPRASDRKSARPFLDGLIFFITLISKITLPLCTFEMNSAHILAHRFFGSQRRIDAHGTIRLSPRHEAR